ncbi:hypothetical protein [Verrucomicrobium spinosum]|uniref:hypothetical protein n=1 Tax=Verrucomicrobium spinosum TaxID=2736 RepID=UPI000174644B|nr:hypothetical protein [Verrucomicrobium spinosum]
MNTLIQTAFTHLEALLRFVAVLQLGLAVLSFFLPRIMKWEGDISRMSLLVRDVFTIHSWFISITLIIWGVLTWRFAPEMAHAPTELSRWLCGAMGLFWGIRCVLQWTHYSPAHWRGIPSRTVIHWVLFFGYAAWTTVYAMAALQTGRVL